HLAVLDTFIIGYAYLIVNIQQRNLLNQRAVFTALAVGQAEIGTDVAGMKEHLRELNGKVASHEKELNERRNQCPLVDVLEERILDEVDVACDLGCSRFGILVLPHSSSLLKFKL